MKTSNTHRAVIVSAGSENTRSLNNNRGVKHNANIEPLVRVIFHQSLHVCPIRGSYGDERNGGCQFIYVWQ